jgi:hypothetical protein
MLVKCQLPLVWRSLWKWATGRAWSTGGGIRETERPREEVQEALQQLSPQAPAMKFPLSVLLDQL